MRSLNQSLDLERHSSGKDRVSMYVFISEGFSTEMMYFKGVSEHKDLARIDERIELCPLQREPVDSGISQPLALLDLAEKNIDAMKKGKHTIDTVCEKARQAVKDVMGEKGINNECVEVETILREKLQSIVCEDRTIADMNMARIICEDAITEVTGTYADIYLKDPVSFDPSIDKVIVLVDRDSESHSRETMQEFIKRCKDLRYTPVISNPCFELWLMLHFTRNLDEHKLLRNEMIGGQRYTVLELDRILQELGMGDHYHKNELDPMVFIYRADAAVENSKYFCHNIRFLVDQVGTNLGDVFEEMQRRM